MTEKQPIKHEVRPDPADMLGQAQLARAILAECGESYIESDDAFPQCRADWFSADQRTHCYLFAFENDNGTYSLHVGSTTSSDVQEYAFDETSATDDSDNPSTEADPVQIVLEHLRERFRTTKSYEQLQFDTTFQLLAAQLAAEAVLAKEVERARFPMHRSEIYAKDARVRRRIDDELYQLACKAELICDKDAFDHVLPTVVALEEQAIYDDKQRTAKWQSEVQPTALSQFDDQFGRYRQKRRWLRFWK